MRHIDHACVSCIQVTDQRAHTWEFENDVIVQHNIECYDISLAFYSYTHFWQSCDLYVAITVHED